MKSLNKVTIKQLNNLTILTIITILAFSSCKKDDPKKPVETNPQEVLTTVLLTGYNIDDSLNAKYQFNYKWEDLDGDGGNAPIVDTLVLDTGIAYRCQALILDKTKTPFDTISVEIEKEKDEHQFFYTPSTNLVGKFSTEILDFDNNNPKLPVGLKFNILTKSNQTYNLPLIGSLNIVLSHYDGVPKSTSKSDESDIDINFPIRLK
ncbi:MAG: hypothetical protein JHD28_06725 [Bacteroidia bacterium]|nr:hypothetical protein [Bacteroidia bacterium]